MDNPALIPFDCGDEEIGLLLKRALQDLRASTDEILNQANTRLGECQQRLAGYNRRLANVERKFEHMKQSEEVPLITSPAEFPGKIHLSRSLVFRRSTSATPFINRQKILRSESCPKPISIKEMVLRKNGYRFIFPRGKHNEKQTSRRVENQQISSLIKPRKKKHGIIKPEEFYNLKMSSTSNGDRYSPSGDFASNSLLIYDNLKAVDSADPFTYKPGMGNLTEFDLPEVLPQLTGTSNNVYAKKESLFGICQSDDEDNEDIFGEVTKRKMDVDLTARSTFYMLDEPMSRRSTHSRLDETTSRRSTQSRLDVKLPETSTSGLPVQKPVEPQQIVIEPTLDEPPEPLEPPMDIPIAPPRSVDVVKSPAVPPPPPPPPPVALIPPNLASIPSPPGRDDLMQAIRAAGGVKKAGLKKIEIQESGEPAKPAKKSSSKAPESTDDLMSSLSKALERRRKGISGKTAKKFEALEKSGGKSSNSTFSTLRELIPPPTKENDSDSESGNEEDWK